MSNANVCNINDKHRRATIKDIAQVAGVSHSTVSRSLNDSPLISDATKEKIKQIAHDMGFEFNANARSLSTRKTGTIGIIYPELFDEFRNALYSDLLFNGIRQVLDQHQIDSLGVFPYHEETGRSNIQRLIKQRKVDGLLLIHPMIKQEDWEFIQQTRVPHILLHYRPHFFSFEQANYAFADNLNGGYMATEALIKAGAKRILCYAIKSDNAEMLERTEGFKKAMNQYNLPMSNADIIEDECYFHIGKERILKMVKKDFPYDAIFVQADLLALGVIDGLKESGIHVPEQVKIVGYDDIELGNYYYPRLTTIHQPREQQTDLACRRLIDMIDGKTGDGPLQAVFQPRLVYRDSCPAT